MGVNSATSCCYISFSFCFPLSLLLKNLTANWAFTHCHALLNPCMSFAIVFRRANIVIKKEKTFSALLYIWRRRQELCSKQTTKQSRVVTLFLISVTNKSRASITACHFTPWSWSSAASLHAATKWKLFKAFHFCTRPKQCQLILFPVRSTCLWSNPTSK